MLFSVLSFFLLIAHSSPSTPEKSQLVSELNGVQKALVEGKNNLKTTQKNLETISLEYDSLKRLESEHVQLKGDIQEQIKTVDVNDKAKAKQSFLFKASKLEADVQKQLSEIRSRFGPLENERKSWEERRLKYESALAELAKKELALQEQLGEKTAPPSRTDEKDAPIAPQKNAN